jgi:thiamine biosynthesis lipoprotein
MGCELAVDSGCGGDFDAVLALFEERERLFSRFRPDSELERVNAATGAAVRVSDEFARALRTALRAAAATGGLVEPTVGAALLASGYDDDFDRLAPDPRPPAAAPAGRWRELRLDGRLLWRPPGLVRDLNGVVKSQAVDDALRAGSARLVSAGGDLAVSAPTTVELPSGGEVELRSGGLATSGTVERRWVRGGEWQHHLIDPRTGRPAVSPWDQVTVAARSCLEADVAAKAAFLLGDGGPAWLDARGLPGRFLAGGRATVNDAWRRALSQRVLSRPSAAAQPPAA